MSNIQNKKIDKQAAEYTYTLAMERAMLGQWREAWELAQQDIGLLPHVTEEMWVNFAVTTMQNKAKLFKSSEFHSKKIQHVKEYLTKHKRISAIVLFDHMVIVADNNELFKTIFDETLISYQQGQLINVTQAFGVNSDDSQNMLDSDQYMSDVDEIDTALLLV
ncbi:MAG: hypothetical protein HAW67_05320 [Endozoicomonadaceae bacterium]|nr:hypothetical protein [Endozoicomonadaceae bacterium]